MTLCIIFDCCIVGRSSSRRIKGIGIFKLPAEKVNKGWREAWLNEITKTRVVDKIFKEQLETG